MRMRGATGDGPKPPTTVRAFVQAKQRSASCCARVRNARVDRIFSRRAVTSSPRARATSIDAAMASPKPDVFVVSGTVTLPKLLPPP
jgi:hypothetical protein